MEDFTRFYFPKDSSSKRLVYKKGSGAAVILMHELPEMIPECVDLGRRLAKNFTVYLPLLFGEPDQPLSLSKMVQYTALLCISQEFYCKAALGVSPEELAVAKERANNGVPILALRFSEDKTSPQEKVMRLRQEFGEETEIIEDSTELCWKRGAALETIEINSKPGNPYKIAQSSHAVLTLGYREQDHPANRVYLNFLHTNIPIKSESLTSQEIQN